MLRAMITTRVVSNAAQTMFITTIAFIKYKISSTWKLSIILFLLGRIFFSLWGVLIWSFNLVPDYMRPFYVNIEPITTGISGALLGMWQRWDAIHYQRIVIFGYEDAQLTAFFPLFPLLGKLISFFTGASPILGLILVSNIAFFLSLYFLYDLASEIFSPDLARQTLISLLIFPTAFYFYAILPQSLLFLLILLSYWSARKGKWIQTGIIGLLAGLTHPLCVPLTLLLGWEAFLTVTENRSGNRIAACIAPFTNLIGIIGFMTWRKWVGFPSYIGVQTQNWGTTLHLPWDGLATIGKHTLQLKFTSNYFIDWLEVLFFVLITGLLLWSAGKIPMGMWLYNAGVMILFVGTNHSHDPLLAILRYPVMMFPLFIVIAAINRTNKVWQLIKFSFSLVLGLICATLYFMWSLGFS